MKVRAATAADASAICDIVNPMIRDTLVTFTTIERSVDEIKDLIDTHPHRVLVAEFNNEIIGFASCGPFRSGPGYANTCEHTLYVGEGGRGQGVGRRLLERLEIQARNDGVHSLVGAISGANPGAIRFHAQNGFAQAGRLHRAGHKFGQWIDLVLMQKFIG